ncbi:hypothetical protein [Craterilacuibacter sinensis]|uniref:Phosphohydrolase n=1 Tax=Craterilacuibacter sinensis TaxID=2686017 RepID=A0A845BH36_9NEIS|nr:hypothetical protein [Craterilacuibacter sinensis]MXR36047.1 hypothetical protein [Craterilacuibacter sinensis]
MDIISNHPQIEQILGVWKEQIGETYDGYRGHVYRMFNCCLALRDCSEEEVRKLAIAAAFHDIGLWSAHTADYLPPSVAQAQKWLAENGLSDWAEEISLMIDMHHKIRPWRDPKYPLVEVFRQGDLVDFSLGFFKFGLPSAYVSRLKAEIPNAGFHKFLLSGAKDWFCQHPLSPPPFMKW